MVVEMEATAKEWTYGTLLYLVIWEEAVIDLDHPVAALAAVAASAVEEVLEAASAVVALAEGALAEGVPLEVGKINVTMC